MIVFPNAKINIGLHVIDKRPDGYHNLETIFYPVQWQDALEIVIADEQKGEQLSFSSSGNSIDVNPDDNLCMKAYRLLKNDHPKLPAVKIHLHKVIPSGAGLGGGSSDASFTLSLLNKMFALGLNQQQLLSYALQLGSDCPFFIINQPSFAEGRGEKLSPVEIDLSAYKLILVHPGISVSTKDAFSKIKFSADKTSLKELVNTPVEEWKHTIQNDFEGSVFSYYPEIAAIKKQIYDAGAIYASMSGSGSTVFGVFEKEQKPAFSFPSTYVIKIIE